MPSLASLLADIATTRGSPTVLWMVGSLYQPQIVGLPLVAAISAERLAGDGMTAVTCLPDLHSHTVTHIAVLLAIPHTQ